MTEQRHASLVLVVGPSGAGKDTLIDAARATFANEAWIAFPRRIVTRAADAGGEAHIALSPAAFAAARTEGRFCLSWDAHGFAYGIPTEVIDGVKGGTVQVVNASRRALSDAEALGVHVIVLHVTAAPETLAARLAGRGRESMADMRARLAREAPLASIGAKIVEVSNDGTLKAAIARFCAALAALHPRAHAGTGCESGRPGSAV